MLIHGLADVVIHTLSVREKQGKQRREEKVKFVKLILFLFRLYYRWLCQFYKRTQREREREKTDRQTDRQTDRCRKRGREGGKEREKEGRERDREMEVERRTLSPHTDANEGQRDGSGEMDTLTTYRRKHRR
jgi:hypothetical protein